MAVVAFLTQSLGAVADSYCLDIRDLGYHSYNARHYTVLENLTLLGTNGVYDTYFVGIFACTYKKTDICVCNDSQTSRYTTKENRIVHF